VSLVGQMRKGAPATLLGQRRQQQIELMDRRQQGQQMEAPELSGTEGGALTSAGPGRPEVIDEIVGNVGIKAVQEPGGAGSGQ
jgi:hypothetical protein